MQRWIFSVGVLAALAAWAVPVLGQVSRPQLFAPGVISTGDDEWGFTMSPDGRSVWFNKAERSYRYQAILESRLGADGRWSEPEVASFSGRWRDIDPAISPDGKRLVFASRRPLREGEPDRSDFDLWAVDRLPGGTWSEPWHLGPRVNSSGSETNSSIAADGSLYFAANGRPGTSAQVRTLYRSRLTPEGYGEPQALPAPVNSGNDESNHWIAPDQSYLIFLSSRPGGLGQADLYISFRSGEQWSALRNLGPAINRAGSGGAFTPFVSADGRTLYFADRIPSQFEETPARPLSAVDLQRRLRSPGNGNGDLYFMPWAAEAYR